MRCWAAKLEMPSLSTSARMTIVERRQHLRRLAAADGAAIFTQGDIAAPVQTIFDLPVLTDEMEQTRGRCDLRGKAGDAIDSLGGGALAAGNASLQLKDLGDIRPLGGEIVVELAYWCGWCGLPSDHAPD